MDEMGEIVAGSSVGAAVTSFIRWCFDVASAAG
jgi:hypothetical protein